MTRKRMEQLENAAERARLAGCTYTSEEIDRVDEVQHLLRLARLAPLLAAEVEAWRRQDKGLCENWADLYHIRDGLQHVPITSGVVRSQGNLDTALRTAGLTLEQIAKEGT